jgi:2-(1,2-epoxy-1,2-dihydrophenyl)acetyl-CoA isomerase
MSLTLHSHDPDIRVERDEHIATVTIDRPASKNACTGDMWVALGATFRDLSWAGVRCIVLTGAGGDFCAGADLGGRRNHANPGATAGAPARLMSMVDSMRVLADAVLTIHQCPVPVIAKVDGVCVGAGLGLSLAADLSYCSDRAKFSAIFAKRGLSLDFGTSWLLRQRVGVHRAKELAFTAKSIGGAEAHALGLVNGVVDADELDAHVAEVAATIAAGPPIALSMTKRQIDNAASMSLAQALEVETLAQSVNVQTHDTREALTAYMERRTPEFEGR